MGNYNRRTDWNRVERLYRAGLLTVPEIGKECNVGESLIRYHAKTKGWKRDLTSEVRRTTRTKLVENLAKFKVLDDGKAAIEQLRKTTDEEIIEQAAKTQVEVVRQHQRALGQGHSLVMRMLSELDATTSHNMELQNMISATVAPARQEALRRAVGLGSRATIIRDLATAARILVTLERQAFNIVDESKERSLSEKKLDEMTAEQLRTEILSDAKKLGLELSSDDFGQGVVAKETEKTTH